MRVALVGNQNCGKTSLFNALTGTNQKIGNWPGVTVERKEGVIQGTDITIVDLPGVYSLKPYTTEEEITRSFLLKNKPDLLINVVDATSIERSLYLTMQLLEMNIKTIVVLNMSDILEKKGIEIDNHLLSEKLGVPILNVSALKKRGISELVKTLQNEIIPNYPRQVFPYDVELIIEKAMQSYDGPHKRFFVIEALEKKSLDILRHQVHEDIISLENKYKMDIEELIVSLRYDFIGIVKKECFKLESQPMSITDRLDKIFLNKWAAIPIFFLIMFAIYYFTVGVIGRFTGVALGDLFSLLSEAIYNFLVKVGASPWAVSLVVDGVIGGIGAVVAFLPQLIMLFFFLALLETSGYMSRIAFLLDRLFCRIGLSGKSLIPFIVGSGCSVPGIMSTKIIENDAEKKMTVILTPFIPCSAKLPIIALFASFFFDKYAGLVSVSLYFLSILIIIISALVMKKFIFKNNKSTFISELPEYRLPSISYIATEVVEKVFAFIKRAGSIILLCSLGVWFLASFTWKIEYIDGINVSIENSILASLGNCLAWVFYPILGEWSWAGTVSAIQGLVAKEQVASSMKVLAGLTGEQSVFESPIFNFFTPGSAYAFMAFNLFSAPCIGAIAAMKKELGSSKKMFMAIAFQTGFAWLIGTSIFTISYLVGVMF